MRICLLGPPERGSLADRLLREQDQPSAILGVPTILCPYCVADCTHAFEALRSWCMSKCGCHFIPSSYRSITSHSECDEGGAVPSLGATLTREPYAALRDVEKLRDTLTRRGRSNPLSTSWKVQPKQAENERYSAKPGWGSRSPARADQRKLRQMYG